MNTLSLIAYVEQQRHTSQPDKIEPDHLKYIHKKAPLASNEPLNDYYAKV